MTQTGEVNETFSADWWEDHYREHRAPHGEPSPHLVATVARLPIGTALDAGCGPGSDARWLAAQGWRVTAVDVSPTVIQQARERTADGPAEVAQRIAWVAADLATWEAPQRYDLVVSQYVHPGIPFERFVSRLADAVGPRGTLLVVGHDHADTHSRAHAPEDPSVTAATITAALDPEIWRIDLAETRGGRRHDGGREDDAGDRRTSYDVVVVATRA